MNNEKFWEEYLDEIKKRIIKLASEKEQLYIDFHIHSTYSADGKQTIKEILKNAQEKKFDIISITDHDTLDAYDEIYNYIKEGITTPIIIPGIEFTLDNPSYKNQFHMLQLFVNPKDKIIINDVNKSKKAMFNRSKIQFKRINQNQALQNIFKKKNIIVSYNDFIKYLNNNKLVPEYDSLCSYLMDKFTLKKITTFDILNELEKVNLLDIYEDRKLLKESRYKKLREKYEVNDQNKKSIRFLLSMLAVREVDDSWWDIPCGSLSVNSYGQLKIEELNKKYKCFFAHPEEKKLDVVKKILNYNPNIIALEQNIRSNYENIDNFYKILNEEKKLRIIGSDSHDNSMIFYKDMNYYKISSNDILNIIDNL